MNKDQLKKAEIKVIEILALVFLIGTITWLVLKR